MRALSTLLDRASAAGLRLELADGRLRCLAPNGRIEPELRQLLSAHKAELLALLSTNDVARATGPMSPAQEAIFYEALLDPASTAYNMNLVLPFEGRLDTHRFSTALEILARRHPALRTVYRADETGLTQEVRAPEPVVLTSTEATDQVEEALARFLALPFDLETGPVFRAGVFFKDDSHGTICLSVHHLAADAVSLLILLSEAARLYSGLGDGTEPDLGPPGRDYLSYARAEQAWQLTGAGASALRAAVDLFDRPPPPLDLGPEDARGARREPRSRRWRIERDCCARLDAAAREIGASRFEWLAASFVQALAAVCAVEEVLLGLTTSTRFEADLASTVGYFINIVPVRVRAAENDPMRTAAAGVRTAVRAAYGRARIPLAAVRKEALRRGWPEARPLFAVGFNYVGVDYAPPQLEGLRLCEPSGKTDRATFRLNIQLQVDSEGVVVSIQYDASVSTEKVERILAIWKAKLAQHLDSPELERSVL